MSVVIDIVVAVLFLPLIFGLWAITPWSLFAEWWHRYRIIFLGGQIRDVESKFHRADEALAREHRRARQRMNDAAGQSWRNYVE